MGARGRKSPTGKVVQLRTLQEMDLPAPPVDLSPEAAQEWVDQVVSWPPDRFPRSTWPMLEGYCVHAVEQRKVIRKLNAVTEETSLRDYETILRMLGNETKLVASLAVRLGIARTSMTGRHNHDPEQLAEIDLPWKT